MWDGLDDESGRTGWDGVSVISTVLFIVVGMNVSMHQLSILEGEAMTLFEANPRSLY
jgi:hypothetical protein